MRLVLIIGLMFILVMPLSLGVLNCRISTTGECGSDYPVFSMMGSSNSHAGEWNKYSTVVCCSGLKNPKRNTGAEVLWLGASENSHAYAPGSYSSSEGFNIVKLGSDSPIGCEVREGACSFGYTPLASMMQPTNSHVGIPGAHDYNICCKILCVGLTQSCALDPCCDGLYCSNITPNGPTAPHCCGPGTYWDDKRKGCFETEACYDPTRPEDYCPYLPPNNPLSFGMPQTNEWKSYSLCLSTPSRACCYVQKYGTNPFYDTTDQIGQPFVKVYGIK